MSFQLIIGDLNDARIEMAERKGIGHPDSICDALVEAVSIALCRYYIKEFGSIMHYNIDKALLVGGQSSPKFGGGKITEPIQILIAGRATTRIGDKLVPLKEIAEETVSDWFRNNMHHLNYQKDVALSVQIREGSTDLTELFHRTDANTIALSNDTSLGAGFYPPSKLQQVILSIDNLLNAKTTKELFPCIGNDTKVMGVNNEGKHSFTIAIAMIARFIENINDYKNKINSIKDFIRSELNLGNSSLAINTADNYVKESVYLTVSGTSAENGDDGQVGRGNRVNGLITPYFPMTLEASSGKNPVSHVGKIYNHFAMELAEKLVREGMSDEAQVFIVSQIGKPVNEPQVLQFRLKNQKVDEQTIRSFAMKELEMLPAFWKRFLD